MSRKRPLSLFCEWHVVWKVGQAVEGDQESLSKRRVAEKAEWTTQGSASQAMI